MKRIRFTLLIIFLHCLLSVKGLSQQYVLKGKVTDAQLEPLSYVTVQIKGLQIGTRTDDNGHYEFQLDEGEYEIVFSLVGYKKQAIKFVHKKNGEDQNIILQSDSKNLNEVKIVTFKKDKAEELIRNVIRKKDTIQNAARTYTTNVYIRATEENEITLSRKKREKLSDSALAVLESKLPQMSMSEVSIKLDYAYPNKVKENRLGVKNRGNTDNLFFLTTTNGDFSLYNNLLRIPALSETPMLSPISYSGLIAYKYKTLSIEKRNTHTIYTIGFTPNKLGNALLSGELKIVDTSWTILYSRFTFPKYHMPEYDYFEAIIQNELVDDKAWLPTRQEFNYLTKNGKNKSSGRTVAVYNDYKVDPSFGKKYFNNEVSSTTLEAYKKDTNFWNEVRKEPLTQNEVKFIIKSDSIYRAVHSKPYLDSIDRRRNKITLLRVLFLGVENYNRKKERTLSFAPLISSFRPLLPGGTRVGTAVGYLKIFENKTSININVDATYGLINKDIMGTFMFQHIYNPFSQGYYVINGGRTFDLVFTGDAWVNLFRRSNIYLKNTLEIEHGLEVANGLVLRNTVEFAQRKSINDLTLSRKYDSILKFDNEPIDFNPYNAFYASIKLEYTPFQMYIREPRQKIILGSNYPTIYAKWRKGIPSIFKSEINFDYVEFGFFQKLKLGLAGISQYQLFSGEFMSKKELQFIDYKFISRGNPFFFNNPLRSFQALDSTFPIFKRFYEGHYLHHFNGALINKIPFLKKLNILEVAGGGILFVPERKLNYIEGYVGIEKIIRIWRERFKIGFYAVGSLANKYNNPYQIKFGLNQFNKRTNSWY
ncbi:MAG: carboxypeptidase-like regulatory domain-containing protein [Bacteroidetes bacterium]|nr:carboxypeptidase-like regulatory domain-containing protein [Bacteroidota bacterium]MBP6314978.1 carboxypeptidase-like regulatory domain-containing protein [Chitinophagaceae bacterium]